MYRILRGGEEIDQELNSFGEGKDRLIIFDGMFEVSKIREEFVAKALFDKTKKPIKLERVTWFSGRASARLKPVKGSEVIEAFFEAREQEIENLEADENFWGKRHWAINLSGGRKVIWSKAKDQNKGQFWLIEGFPYREKALTHGASTLLEPQISAPTATTLVFVIHGSIIYRFFSLNVSTSKNCKKVDNIFWLKIVRLKKN